MVKTEFTAKTIESKGGLALAGKIAGKARLEFIRSKAGRKRLEKVILDLKCVDEKLVKHGRDLFLKINEKKQRVNRSLFQLKIK